MVQVNTKPKYLLLTPLKGSDFDVKNAELIKQIKGAGCGYILSTSVDDHTIVYITASSTELLEGVCEQLDITGSVIQYSAIFDHIEED